MLNLNNNNIKSSNNEDINFEKLLNDDGFFTNNRSIEETLELRRLKLVSTGFNQPPLKLNEKFSFDGTAKTILENFRTSLIIVDKVIENKNLYYNCDIKKLSLDDNYELIFSKITNELIKKLVVIRTRLFESFIANKNQKDSVTLLLKSFYNRLYMVEGELDYNIALYYNGFNFVNSEFFDNILIRKSLYSVQVFEKMVKLITKTVLLNSKFFFLNNVRYNYTLLKFCDKTMKVINSILLFCLLCDINIPYYCFHSDLSIAGNCRMCLVQLDTSLKPIASCAVSIGINSTIYTNTKIIQKAREGVLEFLLINHPLDCPICDQGGECDLQEQFITYGNDRGRSLKKTI